MRKLTLVVLFIGLLAGCQSARERGDVAFTRDPARPRTPQSAYALARADDLDKQVAELDKHVAEIEKKIDELRTGADAYRRRARAASVDKTRTSRDRDVLRCQYEGQALALEEKTARYRELCDGFKLRASTMRSDAARARRDAKVLDKGKVPSP